MNTVLDDNKKLCLMNGEIILMSKYMTMMFEVENLSQASPATISRCGMIYFQPDLLGWNPIFQSWINYEFKLNIDPIKERLSLLVDAILQKCIDFIQSKCSHFQEISSNSLIIPLIKLFKGYFI